MGEGCTYNVLVTTVGWLFAYRECLLGGVLFVFWIIIIITGVGAWYGLNRRSGKYGLDHYFDISLTISTLKVFCEDLCGLNMGS